ncbi:hypothetical protein GOA89_13095 [Sinorhizobium meliloti]|nr:hypothetical protein [Sinorhizobium meliloti]MDW9847232.1 hypothetical protein [Sinorhizobium meliloti]MDX0147557.1 hypothetical protein [Sinorhizobium meliloti]MDX0150060.1 hypothetical protein [Sinorhizobium meliloti]MDX0169239.1 hypothetical protein [Sinorhizobium meliloti]
MNSAQLKAAMAAEMRRAVETGRRPRWPAGGEQLAAWFVELSDRRTWHATGPNPISYPDMIAWASLMRWPVQPRHIEILVALDNAWIGAFYAKRGTKEQQKDIKTLPARSAHAVSPKLFDAIFG